ncbi:MAG TPA: pyruvate kinase [Chitinophagaceae bacterium]
MSPVQDQLRDELQRLDDLMVAAEKAHEATLQGVHPSHFYSACNLLHYLALRSRDIRGLQERLHEEGLSSLTHSESHIRSQLLAVLRRLGAEPDEAPPSFRIGAERIQQAAKGIFGPCSADVIPCIMVTFDTSFAQDFDLVKRLLQAGMNIARINCARDDENTWLQMIGQIRKATEATGLACRIYMDLAGPKIRTKIEGKKKNRVKLQTGERFYLYDDYCLYDDLPRVGCTLPGIIVQMQVGDRVLFDDGVVETTVIAKHPFAAELQVDRISGKPFLKGERGINFPDTIITLPALTGFDRECLPFIQEHADMVGFSFIQTVSDLVELQEALGDRPVPIIIKVEKAGAVANLPALILQGMTQERYGVMIARGDLAVEIGFERLSEIQEEIMWLCEAAHAPVIWATQVLESLNKKGIATRAEVTDAATAAMAECVMINKGVNTVQVIDTLKDIFYRSARHREKKRYTFRPLSIARNFLETKREKEGKGINEEEVVASDSRSGSPAAFERMSNNDTLGIP